MSWASHRVSVPLGPSIDGGCDELHELRQIVSSSQRRLMSLSVLALKASIFMLPILHRLSPVGNRYPAGHP